MEDIEVDSGTKILDRFDIETELSALVEKNIISQNIADRLEKKLIEKKVNINQGQLQILVNKIGEIIQAYGRNDKNKFTKTENTTEKNLSPDMKQLFDTVEKLKHKISTIEIDMIRDDKHKISTPRLVTIDDVKIPKNIGKTLEEFRFEPLTEIANDAESIIVLMRWLQYLIDKCGHSNLSTILDYYIDIGWITNDVKLSLVDYSNGITGDINNRETLKREISDLPSKDHIQSLFFIQKLKGKEIDKHFIDRIDGELNRIVKKLENYHFK